MFSTSSIIRTIVFFCFFGLSFYALSAVRFDKFFKTADKQKFYILMFLLSVSLAWLASQALLSFTIYGGYF